MSVQIRRSIGIVVTLGVVSALLIMAGWLLAGSTPTSVSYAAPPPAKAAQPSAPRPSGGAGTGMPH